jgi:hypothetical protein
MGVQIVHDKVPASGLRVGSDDLLRMSEEIGLGPCGPGVGLQHFPAYDVPAHNESAGSMTNILILD